MISPTNLAAPVLLKALVITAILLVASGAGNALLLRKLWISEVEHDAEVERLEQAAVVAGLRASRDASEDLARAAQGRLDTILERLEGASSSVAAQHQEYVRRLRTIPPLPIGCGPGEARVDAFNHREN